MANALQVSVIMPVRGRRSLVAAALRSYCQQTWDCREIVIVDDSDPEDDLSDLFSNIPNVVYIVPYIKLGDERLSIGSKRNLGIEASHGDIVTVWDSDDIFAPERITQQVYTLLKTERMLTGYFAMSLFDLTNFKAHRYFLNRQYACGASMSFQKQWWRDHPYPDQDIGEDLDYATGHPAELAATDGTSMMVCLLHDSNVSSRDQVARHPCQFPEIPLARLPDYCFRYLNEAGIVYNPSAVC